MHVSYAQILYQYMTSHFTLDLGDMRGSQATGVLATCESCRLMHTKFSISQTIYSSWYKCEFYCVTFGRPGSLL